MGSKATSARSELRNKLARARARAGTAAIRTRDSAALSISCELGTVCANYGTRTSRTTTAVTQLVREGRRSSGLTLLEIENLKAAAEFAARRGLSLNRHTTIHFEAAGLSDPLAALGAMMKLAGDWLRTKGARLAYVWVREAGESKGEHVHIIWHVPPKLIREFAMRERAWRKQIGARRARGAFHSTPVGRSYLHADLGFQYGQPYSAFLAGMLEYLVKGANSSAAEALKLKRREPGGALRGKRCGTSQNIGRKARAQATDMAGNGTHHGQ